MQNKKISRPGAGYFDWLAGWILFAATVTVSGWSLSAAGCLNRGGYLFAFALAAAFFLTKGKPLLMTEQAAASACRVTRFKHGLPLSWLALTVMIFIGGALYSPNNFDYLTYRLPRVLNWLWEESWFWISTANPRLNYNGTGMEWLMTPLLAFTNSDRLFFLINFLPWLLLPGLIFSVFTKLGVSGRAARWWMWLLPSGYCFVTQAGGMGNDAYAAIWLLGALHYALMMGRARADAQRCLLLSCLAIALLTGVKLSNAPLTLPWLVLLIAHWRRHRPMPGPLTVTALLSVCVLISCAPTVWLNIRHTGHYSGEPDSNMALKNPVYGVAGNTLQLTIANLAPPVNPAKINVAKILPVKWSEKIKANFPRFEPTVNELALEENSAAGLGVTLALTLMLFIRSASARRMNFTNKFWMAALLLGLLALTAKLGSATMSRVLTPYYPLLAAAALLLIQPDGRRLKRRPWKILATLVMSSSALVLILSPARPLLPATLMMKSLRRVGAPSAVLDRVHTICTTYASRSDAFADIHRQLPADEHALAIIQQGDDTIASFWRPFGSRRVVEAMISDTKEELLRQNIHYVAVNGLMADPQRLAELQRQWDAEPVWQGEILDKIQRGAVTWYL
ncbi:MAG: hypothetical protein LBD30_02150, partial [Verrucomicrobiales bacterium]|nr:hypothetical protein [Verrucomicrobiales bacterium]